MFVQIEITTVCNFRCFFCAGRDMAQKHMPMERFEAILARLPAGRYPVCLQGEGEPMTHPRFWNLVEQVQAAGKIPYTITNASMIDSRRVAQGFPEIGVSLDTVDAAEAQRIGRYKLSRVLGNLDKLLAAMGPLRIIVHTVDYGQPLTPLRAYLKSRGLVRHLVQPLQAKADYRRRYPERQALTPDWTYHYDCRYIRQPSMRFFNIEGLEMPCCFIKDTSTFESVDRIHQELLQRTAPASCVDCREIMGKMA